MAKAVQYAGFDGYVSSVVQEQDKTWTITIKNSVTGEVVIFHEIIEARVMPCTPIKVGQPIGTINVPGGVSCVLAPTHMTAVTQPDGCIKIEWAVVAPGMVLAGPEDGATAIPTFRKLKPKDIGLQILKVEFTVGENAMPQDGDQTVIIVDEDDNPFTDKAFFIIRERYVMVPTRDFTYDEATGELTHTVSFNDDEDFQIYIVPEAWIVLLGHTVVPKPSGDTLMINGTDSLMINGTDKFVLG